MKKIVFATTLLSLCLGLPAIPFSSAATAIYSDDNTVKKTLENGMTVVIHEMHKNPLTAINIIVKTGSASEGKYAGSGISHLVEHLMFKDSYLSHNRARMREIGADINGFTTQDYTGYKVTVSSQHAVEALEILKDMLASPSFDALEVKKEKEVIRDEIRMDKDAPGRFALDLTWSLVFKEHPYRYPVIGYEDLFERLGKKEVEDYYNRHYSPHNMVLAISSDTQKEALLKKVENIYGAMERNFVGNEPLWAEPPQLSGRWRTEHRPVSLAHVVMAYKSPSINDGTFYPLDVLATALGEGEGSILTRSLRDDKKLVHYITCQNYTLRDSGLFYVYFIADPEKVDQAAAAVLDELEGIKRAGLSDAETMRSKEIEKTDFLYSLETTENRSHDLAIAEAMTGNCHFSQLYIDKLAAVTAEEVQSAAKDSLKKKYLNKVLIVPEEEVTAAVEQTKSQPDGRQIAKNVMHNGIRLLLCEDHTLPLCTISAIFLGGVRAEDSENNGVSQLISKLLFDGTKERSEEDIKSAIESGGGSLESISGNNTFGVMINLNSADWKTGLEIISDILINSRFSRQKIEKEKALTLAAIKERDDDIVRSGLLAFKQNFFGAHPYHMDFLGTKESLDAIDRDAIERYYASLGVPKNLVISIAGDVPADKVVLEAYRLFSQLKGPEPDLPAPPYPAELEGKKEITLSMKRKQSLVLVGFPAVRLLDYDRYVFEVIDAIMSGSDGRLFSNIRDKLGMTYMVGSVFMPGVEPGCHLFYAATASWNLDSAKDAILKEIKELKRKSVPDDDLQAAKEYLITSNLAALQRNRSFALRIGLDEMYGLGYNNFEAYGAAIESVTAAQIERVAKQYFDLDKCLIVSLYGEDEEGAAQEKSKKR